MPDIRYSQDLSLKRGVVELDWLLTPISTIDTGPALEAALICALGSDSLAGKTDALPDPDDTDRRGWWGDLDADEIWGGWPLGSRLWLLRRAKISDQNAEDGGTVQNAERYARECIRPFVDRGIAARFDVTAQRTAVGRIDVLITIYRGPEPPIELRYAELWDELGIK